MRRMRSFSTNRTRSWATFQVANSKGLCGRGRRKGLSSAKLLARLPSLFWKGMWLNVSRRSQIASFSSNRDKNWQFRRAASMKVEMIPTVPSTAALSLGARTLAGRIAVP